jgi:hypothetical protein
LTKEAITSIQNETRESQGEVVDRALSVLAAITPEAESRPLKKQNKRDAAIQQRASTDVIASVVERDDIDYSDIDSTPTTHVATLDAIGTNGPQGKVSLENWRAKRKPLLKPRDRE